MRQLWPYLDGSQSEAIQERVAEHLAQCATCQSHFDFANRFVAAIHVYGGLGGTVDASALRIRVLRALAPANGAGE